VIIVAFSASTAASSSTNSGNEADAFSAGVDATSAIDVIIDIHSSFELIIGEENIV